MTPKSSIHVIQGMQKDTSKSKVGKEFAFHNHNIRITAREDNTLLSITNEKGTNKVSGLPGDYIGHCVIKNNIVVFLHQGTFDFIYLIHKDEEDKFHTERLYRGNLNLSKEYPIEALGVYENESIQKVYWVDSKNSPRVINIKSPSEVKLNWTDSSFDFIPELQLQEDVEITSVSKNSNFPAGVVQYAFSYYYKYGQESCIFNTSPLCYVLHNNTGLSPEKTGNRAFKIKIKNVDTKFDYVRIYSIHRTSLDAVPTTRIVADVPLYPQSPYLNSYSRTTRYTYGTKNILRLKVKEGFTETINKNGKLVTSLVQPQNHPTKENVKIYDINPLMYEGYDLVIGEYNLGTGEFNNYTTIDIEGNGHFIIEEISPTFPLREEIKTYVLDGTYEISSTSELINKETPTTFIINSIQENTEPAYVEYIDDGYSGEDIDPSQLLYIGGKSIIASTITQKDNTLFLGNIELKNKEVPEDIKKSIQSLHLQVYSRNIQQNYAVKDKSTANDSYYKPGDHYRYGIQLQSSDGNWSEPIFIEDVIIPLDTRPIYSSVPALSLLIPSTISKKCLDNGYKKARGLVVFPYENLRKVVAQGILCPTVYNKESRLDNNPYAQSSWFVRPNLSTSYMENYGDDEFKNEVSSNVNKGAYVEFRHGRPLINGANRGSEIQNGVEFKIDQSVLTFHTPDLDFLKNEESGLKLRIVGLVKLTSNYGDINILTSTPPVKGRGFVKNKVEDTLGSRSLVSGLFYEDTSIKSSVTGAPLNLVYPWHRSGSVNKDSASHAANNERTQSAVLKIKQISNYKNSEVEWLKTKDIWDADGNGSNYRGCGISNVSIFDSDQISLCKIKDNTKEYDLNYFGNIDTILVTESIHGSDFSFYVGESFTSQLHPDSAIEASGNVRMKYKSTPHAVFSLKNSGLDRVILPTLERGINLNGTEEEPLGEDKIIDTSLVKGTQLMFVIGKGYPNYHYELSTAKDGDIALYYTGYYGNDYTCIVQELKNGIWVYWSEDDIKNTEYFYYASESEGKIIQFTYNLGVLMETARYSLNYNIGNADVKYIIQDTIPVDSSKPYLFLAELYRDDSVTNNAFGGNIEVGYKDNLWLPAGKSYSLSEEQRTNIIYEYGDTRFQKYECLKTYAFTPEDENQIVEIIAFPCETRNNLLGRYDKNQNKISHLNTDSTNFNLFNPVYTQKNNFFNYRLLDNDLYKLNNFTNTITWSKEKNAGESVDTWTNITMANTLDLDGTKGTLNKLITYSNKILAFQDKGIADILFNSRVQIPVSDGVPIEITNGYKVEGYIYKSDYIGCSNKHSIITTPSGVYFLDTDSSSIYLLADGLTNISTEKGFESWTREVAKDSTFKSFYDENNKDVYFNTDTYSLCYSEKLNQFTSFYDYNGADSMFNVEDTFLCIKNIRNVKYLHKMFDGDYNNFFEEVKPYSITFISNDSPYIDKIFTNIEYQADMFDSNNKYLENESFDTLEVWNEYQQNKIPLIYNKYKPSSLKKKFRLWDITIPRDKKNKLDRMRNPWLYIKLSKEKPGTSKIELHDIVVKYLE